MKHWIGIFFIYLFAVTSGVTQFSFHSCKVDGLHVLQHDCASKKENITLVKDCCSKKHQMPAENLVQRKKSDINSDCCEVNYYFGFTPIPQKISKFQLSTFESYFTLIHQNQLISQYANIQKRFELEKIPPKPIFTEITRIIDFQSPIQVWVI